MNDLVCLECWRPLSLDPFHFDCTGDHFVSGAEAAETFEWLNGRYWFMVNTGQRELTPDSGAVI